MVALGCARKAKPLGPLALGLVAALALAGCQSGDDLTGSIDDYHARHPIVVTDAPTTLDVFPSGQGALDANSSAEVRQFAARYTKYGVSKIVILTPAGGGPKMRAGVNAIRRALASAGLGGRVGLGSYAPADPLLASPIKLSFVALKAEAPAHCGQWPEDLASGSSLVSWKNETYWNFGCATQSMLAAQVDNPRDFVQAGPMGPSDVQMRLRAINAVRNGTDPGTSWQIKNSDIGSIGGS